MRGFLIVAAVLAVLIFLLPFLLSFIFLFVCAVAVLMLLARFGLIPGTIRRTYTFGEYRRENPAPPSSGGWYQGEQDGEVVTLPDGSLKKDGE